MSAPIPSTEPERFVRGDTVKWTISLPDYLPTDGWTLRYAFTKLGTAAILVAATDNGDGTHLVSIPPATSDDFVAGDWGYQAYVTLGSPVTEQHTIRTGTIVVDPSYAGATTGLEVRSFAQQMLDAAEAALIETATNRFPVSGYSFSTGQGSRSVTVRSYEELVMFRDRMKAEVAREKAAERIAQGLGSKKKVVVRFV